MKTLSISALFVGLLLASCGGGKPAATNPEPAVPAEPTEPATTEPTTEPAAEPAQAAWKDMNFGARKKFMKEKVLPEMKALFTEFDAEEFGEFNCQTCHGEGAVDGSFEMPNEALPKLPNTQEGWKKLGAEHPKGMEFMAMKVKPTMARLLGQPEFDPAAPDKGGFACGACHASE